ncbi:hypothetical protein [uncultured Helicobacter sp.]
MPLPNRVPDAAAPRDSINLLKNAVYERAAEGWEALPHTPIASFAEQNLH